MSAIKLECLHVDDEMWDSTRRATRIAHHIYTSIADGQETVRNLPPALDEVVPLPPVRLKSHLQLAGIDTVLSLTQAGSFEKARQLLNKRYYHMVITDAVDGTRLELRGAQDFASFSGYRLLRDVQWRSTQRLLYSVDYSRLHLEHRVDIAAGELSAFLCDHPLSRGAEARFAHRIQLMAERSVRAAVLGASPYFVRHVRVDEAHECVELEVLEQSADGWRSIVPRWILQARARHAGERPGPGGAQYAVLMWFLGYSRARTAGLKEVGLPEAGKQGVGSWVRALTEAYKALIAGRDKEQFPDKVSFEAYVSRESGLWPDAAHWIAATKRPGQIPPLLNLQVLDYLCPVRRHWMPNRLDNRTGVDRDILTTSVLDHVTQFLPCSPDDNMFPPNVPGETL